MGSEIQRVDPETISSSSSTGNSTSTPASPAIATASSQGMHHCGATIAELAIFIDEHDVESGARLVLHTIRPTWRADHIQFKVSYWTGSYLGQIDQTIRSFSDTSHYLLIKRLCVFKHAIGGTCRSWAILLLRSIVMACIEYLCYHLNVRIVQNRQNHN